MLSLTAVVAAWASAYGAVPSGGCGAAASAQVGPALGRLSPANAGAHPARILFEYQDSDTVAGRTQAAADPRAEPTGANRRQTPADSISVAD